MYQCIETLEEARVIPLSEGRWAASHNSSVAELRRKFTAGKCIADRRVRKHVALWTQNTRALFQATGGKRNVS